MLGSCCACAKEAPAHSAVTRTARRALPVELGMDGTTTETQRRTNDRWAIARERHGLFRCGASAAARVRNPSIQHIRERYSDHVPPGPNTWTLNIQPLDQVRPHYGFQLSPIHIVQQCGLLATYRPVSCLSASTICRCITAIGRTIGEQDLPEPHCGADFMVHCRCFTDSGALS